MQFVSWNFNLGKINFAFTKFFKLCVKVKVEGCMSQPIPTTHTIVTTLHVTIILSVPSSIHTQVINTDTKFKKPKLKVECSVLELTDLCIQTD